ncbi:YceI family protein [Candidatus Parcubacteria bacterium]|nr:MAG: YceI family protein [Candidatus Parcubacteria bacterium]
MKIMKTKLLVVSVVLVGIVGGGLYFYLARPIAPPSADIGSVAERLGEAGVGGALYRISSSESRAEFNVDEVLRGVPTTVVGTTSEVAGDVVLDVEDPGRTQVGQISVNARTLKTDNNSRNGAISRFILRSENPENEFITFKTTALSDLPDKIVVGEPFPVVATGDLTVSGVTREVTFTGIAELISEDKLRGSAQTVIRYPDFGLTIPEVPFVANVGKDVTLKINFVANRVEQ